MTAQTFPVGDSPQVMLTDCHGDVTIEVGEAQIITVECDEAPHITVSPDNRVAIQHIHDDIRLRVPATTVAAIANVHGDVAVCDIQSIALETINGSITINTIDRDVFLTNIQGDIEIRQAESCKLLGRGAEDVEIHDVAMVEIETIDSDLIIVGAQAVTIETIGGDCTAESIAESFRYGTIGADLAVTGTDRTHVTGGQVGGDLVITYAQRAQVGEVGGDLTLAHIQGVQVGSIGGDLEARSITGDLSARDVGGDCAIDQNAGMLRIGHIGGDANLHHNGNDIQLGNIGGDLKLATAFPPTSVTRICVGGDARIDLPNTPSLTIHATVGGKVSGKRIVSNRGGGVMTIVYGEGAARLDLVAGGDLDLRGGDDPRISSATDESWEAFGGNMNRLGTELSIELRRMAADLERELSIAFEGNDWGKSKKWVRKAERHVERLREWLEKQAEHIADHPPAQAQAAKDRISRLHVRINDREWRFDPERLERLKEQARQAAQEGIAGAIEAVDRALSGMRSVPTPPTPPNPPSAPGAPDVSVRATPTSSPYRPSTGETIRIEVPPPDGASPVATMTSEPTSESERAAILRMVAEGRISPDEGDLLLDALG